LRAGQQVVVSGYDFLPGSTVNVYVYSTPRLLGSVTVDAQGAFSTTVTLPADLADGTHHLVASGVDGNGNPKYLVVEVSVTGGVAGVEPAAASGASTGMGTGGSTLAYTGFEPLPWLTLGGVLLVTGSALVVAGRRRRAGA